MRSSERCRAACSSSTITRGSAPEPGRSSPPLVTRSSVRRQMGTARARHRRGRLDTRRRVGEHPPWRRREPLPRRAGRPGLPGRRAHRARRRPGNAIGPLMIAYAFVQYFGNWGNINVPVLPLLGVSVGQWAGAPILAQIALSYPTGRLRTTFDRVVIGLIYAAAISICIVILLGFDPRSAGCTACAWEPALFPSRSAFMTVPSVYQRAGAILPLMFFLAVWLRFRRATPAERRDLAPLWGAVCVIALVYLMSSFASPFPLADSFSYLIWELQGVPQISLPAIFVGGLLSARLARSAVGDLVVELERPLPPGELRAS